eukprot:6920143-Pyramimonas_sp.AAC.1
MAARTEPQGPRTALQPPRSQVQPLRTPGEAGLAPAREHGACARPVLTSSQPSDGAPRAPRAPSESSTVPKSSTVPSFAWPSNSSRRKKPKTPKVSAEKLNKFSQAGSNTTTPELQ